MLKFSFWGFAHHGAFLACATATVLACSNDGSGEETAQVATTDDDAASDETDDDPSDTSTDSADSDSSDSGGPASGDDTASQSDDVAGDGESVASTDQAPSNADAASNDASASATDPADDGEPPADGAMADAVCEQGATRECVGAAACAGGQICGVDGLWGACDCGEGGQAESASAADPEPPPIGDEYILGMPLIPQSGPEPRLHEWVENPDIGLFWAAGAGLEAQLTVRDDGAFCLSGEARHYNNYELSDLPGLQISFAASVDGDATQSFYNAADRLYGFQFEVAGTPSTGVAVRWGAGGDPQDFYLSEVWWYVAPTYGGTDAFLFSDASQRFDTTKLVMVHFLAHWTDNVEAETEPQPFDFCVVSLRPILIAEP